MWAGNSFKFLIKSYILADSHLNFFKFATLINCFIPINM